MKRSWKTAAFAVAALPGIACGHHSRANFDLERIVQFEAKVVRFQFSNPHSYLYVQAPDSTGKPVDWTIELNSLPNLVRMNIGPRSFAPGDIVQVRANPERNPAKKVALFNSIVKSDGVRLAMEDVYAYGNAARKTFEGKPGSTDFSGTWSIERSRTDILNATHMMPPDHLTPAGKKLLGRYNAEDNPVYRCVPEALPSRIGSNYPMIIERRGNLILIKDEVSPQYRTIYLDDSALETKPAASPLGVSIGRIENGELIVDTKLFVAEKWGLAPGLDSSPSKHVHERYWLADRGRELHAEVTVTDSAYLSKPYTVGYTWKYAPTMKLAEYVPCSRDSAAKHLSQNGGPNKGSYR